jgi:hypothetical protein
LGPSGAHAQCNSAGDNPTDRIELDVTYKTALQFWKRVSAVLRAYRGHNKGFGKKVEAYITSQRPKSRDGMTNWREKNKKLLNGGDGVPKITGLLSSSAPEGSENLDRTERLLRLLIAATPKPSKSAKSRQLKRGMASAGP